MLVKQILSSKQTSELLWIAPEKSVQDAVNLMSNNRVGTIVASPDGKTLAGILSERDVVREVGKRGPDCLKDAVADMMTSKIVTCREDQTALAILKIMTDGRFRHMPVMDGEVILGLISIGDVVKGRLSELAMEKDALEGMIMGH